MAALCLLGRRLYTIRLSLRCGTASVITNRLSSSLSSGAVTPDQFYGVSCRIRSNRTVSQRRLVRFQDLVKLEPPGTFGKFIAKYSSAPASVVALLSGP